MTRFYLYAVLILGVGSLHSQDLEQVAYNIISDIVRQDTLVTSDMERFIDRQMKSGSMSTGDSLTFINRIKKRELRLYRKKANKLFRNNLMFEYKHHGNFYLMFYREFLLVLIARTPEYGEWEENTALEGFTFVDTYKTGEEERLHTFSDLVHFASDLYVIYHE